MTIPAEPENWAVKLAVETAMDYYTRDELLLRSGLSVEVFDAIMASTEFRLAVQEYKREMHDSLSPLKTKATRMLWDSMDNLTILAGDSEVAPADRISAVREIAKLAGIAAQEGAANATATINIVQFDRESLMKTVN